MFFGSWESLARIVILATCTYAALVAALRISGSRSLAKMSGYDFVVTIALGSLIATIPLQKDITLADGLVAIATYLLLQFVLAWTLRRVRPLRYVVKSRPHLVVWNGALLPEQLHRINVTDEEVYAAVRAAGQSSLDDVLAVVLENDGQWSVLPAGARGDHSALSDVIEARRHG